MKIYMARQPIFQKNKKLYAYELLYRDSEKNAYNPQVDGNRATRAVLSDALTSFGLKNLTQGKKAFVNFTRELLLQGVPYMLNPRDFVIEVLETVQLDTELVNRIRDLKQEGYTIALDDYTGNKKFDVLFDYLDIVKVDFWLLTPEKRTKVAKHVKSYGIQLLAEKVETEMDYQQALKEEYDYFQGHYFSQAIMVSIHSTDVATITCLRMLHEISKVNPDYTAMAEIIRRDVNLTYKLLRRINTLEYFHSHRVTSIKAALVHMGLDEVRRWVLLILIREITGKGMDEMTRLALIRGIFAEKLLESVGMGERSYEAFTTGMFSMIDLILEESLPNLLQDLCISEDVKSALLGEKNVFGEMLYFVKMYEQGNWEEAERVIHPNITMEQAGICYVYAVHYADLAIDEKPFASTWSKRF